MENCTQVESTTTLYKPCLHDSDGGCVDVRNDDPSNNNNKDSLNRVDQCQKIPEMDDSQLVGNADVAARGDAGAMMGAGVGNGVRAVEQAAGKRRRGRPPRSQGRSTSSSAGQPPSQRKTSDDEEDVCFICFDGGSLVLCDRRGCPKAYHPACIKRDEAFFKSKAKWNCGWHICSTCQKASHYMCYTCTYSLCKNCTRGADYVNVRGNKGFCGTCMRTIMLIENSAVGNNEMVQVDFDDKTSWEYLFKVYWILLKEKLSLSLDELIKAKNPWKNTAIMVPKGEPSVELYNYTAGSNMEMSCGELGAGNSKRRKTIKQQKFSKRVESLEAEKLSVIKGMPFPEGTNWATEELLEFVAHMRNGDISMISRFDVQALLLEYITRSNLRDPHQKSYIVCDSRLIRLFGKGRVGHFEMLKLLESHFIIQDHSRAIDTIRSESTNAVATQLTVDGNNDSQPIIANDKRRKTRKKIDEKGQKVNPDELAAVDVHNMNLIYLKRNLVENLLDDADKFNDKVIGSFVRIQVPGTEKKQDLYRLVQVAGINKVAEPYKFGDRTINFMLEIVNLDKKEVISMGEISDQEFSEDECQWLQQSIKCGLIKWFTVGEILEKAMALQAVRVNDWLESEVVRVNNLRDLASEKGQTKEFRECVEKLQLLNSPEERQRRLQEIPKVHCDPHMNLYCRPEDVAEELCEKKKGMNEKEPFFPHKGGDVLRDSGSRESSIPPHSKEMDPSVENTEAEKMWYYQDPAGRIQGPFSMTMLRKWSETGHFPPDLRIWRAIGKQDNSVLLVDALNSQYCQKQVLFHDSYEANEGARAGDINLNQMGDTKVECSSNSEQNNKSDHQCGNNASAKSKELHSQSSPAAPVDAINSNAVQREGPLPQWDPVKDHNVSGLPQVSSSLPSSAVPGKQYETPSHHLSEGHGGDKWDSGSIGASANLNKTSDCQPITGNVKQDDTEGKSGKSCAESWKCPPLNDSSNGWGSSSGLISLAKALEAAELNQDINIPDLQTSRSKLSEDDSKAQATESRQSLSSSVPHQDSGPSWSTTTNLVSNGPQLRELAGEWASSTPEKPSAEEWDSNLVPESLKRTDLATDHAAASTSGSAHSSPLDPPNNEANNATGWDPIVPEPNDYSLGDESVSDLLAEVEAMESLNGLASPTSIFRSDGAQCSEPDCFSPVGGLSPAAPDLGKSDALSSTNDLPMHSRSAVTIELFGLSHSEVLDAQKSSGAHSSPSAEKDEDARPSDVSVNQYEAGPDVQHPAPPVTTWGMANVDTTWRAGPETAGTNWGAVQGNANFSWAGLGQGTMNVGYGVGQGTFQENGNYNSGSSAGNPPYWGSQQRYANPRERDFQGRDSSFGRGRSVWNRQSSYGGPPNGAATSFRPPPKGQRVCKYYENGYCKKGASCSFWHP